MDQMYSGGFFKDFYANVVNNCTDEEKREFVNQTTDEDRFRIVSEWPSVQEMKFDWKITCKNATAALALKNKGNSAFQQNNWAEAMDLYNEALLLTPGENEEDLAVLIANRSAVFYHLKFYSLAIDDIKLATPKYPKEKLYKLKERLARCYLAENNFPKSTEAFKETIQCLDLSGLSTEKSAKLEKDAQIMIKMLMNKKAQRVTTDKENDLKARKEHEKSQLNEAVCFDYNTVEGYFAKTKDNINVGDKILEEPAHCSVLLQKYSKTHCHHCFLRTISPLPCLGCTNIVYCSESCRNLAQSSYHQFECSILPLIWLSGSSINCHMAMRIISQRSLDYFIQIKEELKNNFDLSETLRLKNSDYRTVYNLVRHEDTHQSRSTLQYTVMSAFLAYCLSLGDYFANEKTDRYSNYIFIGSLIIRNLHFLKYNTHEIYELRPLKNGPKTVFIGGGVYPTLARFNHSCNPGIVRYYRGTSVVVHAVANIQPGSIIAENYGPIYSQNRLSERQATLSDLYRFDCNCQPCKENWPLYEAMDPQMIRFKCSGASNCDNVIVINSNCNDFMMKCSKCNEFTNILKGLKAVQDTELLNTTAKRHVAAREYEKARIKYQEILNIMDEHLAPPFRDYCLCQQSLKECILQLGNRNAHFKQLD